MKKNIVKATVAALIATMGLAFAAPTALTARAESADEGFRIESEIQRRIWIV